VTTSQVKSGFVYHHLNIYLSLVPLRSVVHSSHRLGVFVGLLGLLVQLLSSYIIVFHVVFLKQRTEYAVFHFNPLLIPVHNAISVSILEELRVKSNILPNILPLGEDVM
jgi:hypothetical protein